MRGGDRHQRVGSLGAPVGNQLCSGSVQRFVSPPARTSIHQLHPENQNMLNTRLFKGVLTWAALTLAFNTNAATVSTIKKDVLTIGSDLSWHPSVISKRVCQRALMRN